jgi:beta-lactamase regulating signal transducer with metallopeptidase domain
MMKHILNNYSEAMGLTLLHSLWQGVIVFVFFAIVFYLLKTSSQRYWAGILALISQFFFSILTFFYFFDSKVTLENMAYPAISSGDEINGFMSLFMEYIDTISLFWLVGIMLLFGRMSVGLLYIQSLRKDVLKSLKPEVKNLYLSLKNKLKIAKSVQLFESAKVTVPMTLGWLKPIVLLPVGLASGLNVKQLEAILAHELAHVKRQDFLINILQSIIEIVFFYHPLVWIISAKVREERENSCDDLALKACGNDKVALAKALASVASYELQPQYAMAFGKKNNSLKNRIKRILGYYPQRSFTILNWGVTALILVVTVGGYVYASPDEESAKLKTETPTIYRAESIRNKISSDSIPRFKSQNTSVVKEVFDEIISHRKIERELTIDLPIRKDIPSDGITLEESEITQYKPKYNQKDSTNFSIAHSNVYTTDWKLRSMIKSLSGSNKNSDIRINKGKLLVDDIEMPESEYQSLFKHLEKSYSKNKFFYDDNFIFRRENGNVRVYFLNKHFRNENFDSFIERWNRSQQVREFQKRLKKAGVLNTRKDFVLDWNQDSTVINGEVLSEKKHKKVLKVLDKMATYESFDSYPEGFKLEKKGIRTKLTGCQE